MCTYTCIVLTRAIFIYTCNVITLRRPGVDLHCNGRRVRHLEKPLVLALLEGPTTVFTLQESRGRPALDDSALFDYQLFSVPELEGFLEILKREETTAVGLLRIQYQLKKIAAKREWQSQNRGFEGFNG